MKTASTCISGRKSREWSMASSGFALTLDTGQRLEGDALLVAIGRTPNSGALNCAAGGIELDPSGMIVTDRQLRTTAPGVYAIGDVAGQPAFTHVSWEDYRRLKGHHDRWHPHARRPRARVHDVHRTASRARRTLTLDAGAREGLRCALRHDEASWIARAIEWGQTSGFYRLVVDKKTDEILGATMVGYETGELIHVILAHMEAGSTWHVLDRSVHIHPTYAEALPSLARMLA